MGGIAITASELDEFEPESALAAADEAAESEEESAAIAPGDADAEEAAEPVVEEVEKGLRKAKVRPKSRKK